MRHEICSNDGACPKERGSSTGDAEWIRILPGDMVESHPVVRDLRRRLEANEAALAAKEREITRLQVAVAFGLRELPSIERDRLGGTTLP